MDLEEEDLEQLDGGDVYEDFVDEEAPSDESVVEAAPETFDTVDVSDLMDEPPAQAAPEPTDTLGEELLTQTAEEAALEETTPQLAAPTAAPASEPGPAVVAPEPRAEPAMPAPAPTTLEGTWSDPFGRSQGFIDPARTADPAAVAQAQRDLAAFYQEAEANWSPQGYSSLGHYLSEKGAYNRNDAATGWLGQAQALARGSLAEGPRGQTWEPNVGWGFEYPASRLENKPPIAYPSPSRPAAPAPVQPASQAVTVRSPNVSPEVAARFDQIQAQLNGQPGGTAYGAGLPQQTIVTSPNITPEQAARFAEIRGWLDTQPGGTAWMAPQLRGVPAREDIEDRAERERRGLDRRRV